MLRVDMQIERGRFRLDVRFTAETPGVIALFGPSGAGKSTIAHAVAGLMPAAGLLEMDGRTWLDSSRGIDVAPEERGIGYVFQDARLFPHLDVVGNLRFAETRARHRPAYVRREELLELLGLQALLSRRVHQLSGGERQRVALARALLSQPRLLLLDEPLAAVDQQRRNDVLPYLERLRDRYAIPMLYVSHQYEEVLRLATEVVLLEEGRVIAAGTPAVLSQHPRLRALVGQDAEGSVVEARVIAIEPDSGLAVVSFGHHELRLALPATRADDRVRLHIPARDVILATEPPRALSVRNVLVGTVIALTDEGTDAVLATLDIDGVSLLSRITRAAATDLKLARGMPVWALLKAAALRGNSYPQPNHQNAPSASDSVGGKTP